MLRGRRRCRGAVLLLLLASVLAPLVLYGGSPVSVAHLPDSTVASAAFDRDDAPNLVWPQVAASLAKDLTIERLGEHKNRVLSATDHWQAVEAGSRSRVPGKPDASVLREEPESRNADEEDAPVIEGNERARLGQGGVIKQVVGSEGNADGFGEPRDGKGAVLQNGEEVGIKLPHPIDAEHKKGMVSGIHTVPNLNSSSSETRSATTSREHQTRVSNSSSARHMTNGSAGQSTTSPDATVHIIKDQLASAKTYLGLVASRGNHGLSRELRARMRDIQRALGDATSDRQLPQNVHSKIRAMEQVLMKVRKIHDSCSGVVNRLRAVVHSTEQQLESNKRQANYLAQVAATRIKQKTSQLFSASSSKITTQGSPLSYTEAYK